MAQQDTWSAASQLINLDRRRINPSDLAARMAERDMREAADNRTECQRLTGDPPFSQSALAQKQTK